MKTDQPSKADELVVLMQAFLEAGETGLSIEQIQDKTGWSHHHATSRVLDLATKVGHYKERKTRVTHYFVKGQ